MPYSVFHFWTLSGVPVTMPARRQCSDFARAGAIWCSLRPPRPTSAIPTFLRDFFAWARVTLVLIKGAATTAAAVPRNRRRVSIIDLPSVVPRHFTYGCAIGSGPILARAGLLSHHNGCTAAHF